MIQAVIARMALSTRSCIERLERDPGYYALFALASANTNAIFVYLAYFPSCNNLGSRCVISCCQQRLFRMLYDDVRAYG